MKKDLGHTADLSRHVSGQDPLSCFRGVGRLKGRQRRLADGTRPLVEVGDQRPERSLAEAPSL